MDLGGSVTRLLRRLKSGRDSALSPLVRRFWPLMLSRARRRIDPRRCRAAGVEDAAQQALWDLYRGLRDGVWKRLDNRQDLVAILLRLTDCRALNQARRAPLPSLDEAALGSSRFGLEQVAVDPALPPDQQAAQEEHLRWMLDQLEESLRPFAEMLLDEWPIARMAETMQCSERTAHRKVALIRARWMGLGGD